MKVSCNRSECLPRLGQQGCVLINTLILITSYTSRPCRHNTSTWRSGRCNSLRWTTASWQCTPTNRRRNTWARSCGGTYGNTNTSLQLVRGVVVQTKWINLVQKRPHVWNEMHIASLISFIYLCYVIKCLVLWHCGLLTVFWEFPKSALAARHKAAWLVHQCNFQKTVY